MTRAILPRKSLVGARERWIEDTQMFQRVAGVAETPADVLGADWDAMTARMRRFAVASISRQIGSSRAGPSTPVR